MLFFIFSLTKLFSQEYKDLPPAPPSGLKVRTGLKRCELFWNKNSESDFLGYNIYYKDLNEFKKLNIELFKPINYDISYYIFDLEQKDKCLFRITAVDRAGNESKPAEIKVDLMKKSYPMADKYWPIDIGDLRNTHQTDRISSQTGTIESKISIGEKHWERYSGISNILIGPDGTIYINYVGNPDADSHFKAYDKNFISKFRIGSAKAIVISSNKDIIYDSDNKYVGISMVDSSGNILWNTEYSPPVGPFLMPDGQIIYSWSKRLESLGYDGFHNWHYDFLSEEDKVKHWSDYGMDLVVDDSSNIYLSLYNGMFGSERTRESVRRSSIYKFNRRGSLIWRVSGVPGSYNFGDLIILNNGDLLTCGHQIGTLYADVYDSYITSLSSVTGNVKWFNKYQTEKNKPIRTIGLLNDGHILCHNSSINKYFLLSPTDGVDICECNEEIDYEGTTIIGGDNTIYSVVRDKLYAISHDLKYIKWIYEGSLTLGLPIISPEGLLLVPEGSNLLIFKIGD